MLRAGFAKLDITPGPECGLIGYEFRQEELPPGNAGVHDPLHARVLVLHDGQAPAVLASLDLCVIETALMRELRAAVAKAAKTTPERVNLSCIHTHSGPFPHQTARGGKRLAEARRMAKKDPDAARALTASLRAGTDYAGFLRGRLVGAAAQAAGLTYPVRVTAQQAPLGLGYNRRVMTPAGLKHCWGPQEWPQLSPGPATDPACTVVLLRQENGPRSYLLWSLGAHPVVLGKTSRVVSADYPGLACKMLEEDLPGCRPMFLLGAAGDTHPWIATQEDPAQIRVVAKAAAAFVALLAQATRGLQSEISNLKSSTEAAEELRIAARTCRIGKNELDLAVWRLGPVWCVFAPVELFGALGADLRRQLPGPVLLATCANGWTGYFPTEAACAEGGYEVKGAWNFTPGDGEKLVAALVDLAATLKG
jgi:hypothetical protein